MGTFPCRWVQGDWLRVTGSLVIEKLSSEHLMSEVLPFKQVAGDRSKTDYGKLSGDVRFLQVISGWLIQDVY